MDGRDPGHPLGGLTRDPHATPPTGGMTATTRCRICGTAIVLDAYAIPDGVIARGDSFFHAGCVEANPSDAPIRPRGPAYFLPRSWGSRA
jgi:hypothetical protein